MNTTQDNAKINKKMKMHTYVDPVFPLSQSTGYIKNSQLTTKAHIVRKRGFMSCWQVAVAVKI